MEAHTSAPVTHASDGTQAARQSRSGVSASPSRNRSRDGWSRLAATLTAPAETDELCRRVCKDVVEAFGFGRALLATLNRTGDRLVARGGHDPDIGDSVYTALRLLYRIPLEPDETGRVPPAAWSFLNREQVHVPDTTRYSFRPRHTKQNDLLVRALGTEEYVITPVVHHGSAVGVLAVDRKGLDDEFAPSDLEALRAVARLISLRVGPRVRRRSEPGDRPDTAPDTGGARHRPDPSRDGTPTATDGRENGFLEMIVHDLRAPLQSVVGFARLLREGRLGEFDDQQRDLLRRIERSGDGMLELVADIGELCALRGARFPLREEPTDARRLVERVLEEMEGKARPREVRLENRVPRDLPPLLGDPVRLRQLLQNLVDNGVEACREGGGVTVSGATENGARGRIVRFEIADDGKGLSPAAARRLFEFDGGGPGGKDGFSAGGRGLGLLIARLVTEAHGGDIRAASPSGGRTTVTVRLPAASREEEE